jgi:hypothetical protein
MVPMQGFHGEDPIWPLIAGAGVAVVIVALMAWTAISSQSEFNERTAAREKMWAAAVVVRICRDGTHVFRLHSGEHWTSGRHSSALVADPDKVCQ